MNKGIRNETKEVMLMYSEEIERFIEERNHVLTPEECNLLMDVNTNTQISNMKYFCANNEYHISTDDGYYFIFRVE